MPTSPRPSSRAAPGTVRAPLGVALLLAALWLPGCEDGTPTVAACQSDADCAGLEDGNACNGTLFCNTTTGLCLLDASTIVQCDVGADDACAQNACNPATGACAMVAAPVGTACEDGEPCTQGDSCKEGVCTAGASMCDCQADADCPDDANLCNGKPYCERGSFPYRCATVPGSVVTCEPSSTACRVAACDPNKGSCVEVPMQDGAPCDDGDACTVGDDCAAGKCSPGIDTCACNSDADCPDLDGDLCNGVRYCDKSGGKGVCADKPASEVVCNTALDTDCLKQTCVAASGVCVPTPVADKTACDDGEACTSGDSCAGGVCKPGTDTCKCTADADCAGQEDGDLCNGQLFCNKQTGACMVNPATIVTCPTVDDTACTKNVCNPASGACVATPRAAVKLQGCTAVDLGGGVVAQYCTFGWKASGDPADPGPFLCDDGDACTQGDACDAGSCKPGKVVCECQSDADCLAKDDGNLCNGVPYCAKDLVVPACKPNPSSEVFCPKSEDTACLKSTCAPKTGTCSLQPLAAGTACDDGNPCTAQTACAGATCTGKATDCDDGDACTVDSCNPASGCVHVAKSCDDGNACTPDSCDAATGVCKSGAHPAGTPCNADSDGCTVGDACDGKGSCKAGSQAICTGKTGECEQNACQSKGIDGFSCAVVARADGTACADGDPCLTGSACKAGSCVAGKTSAVFSLAPTAPGAMNFEAGVFVSKALVGGQGDGSGGLVVAGVVSSGSAAGTWQVYGYDRAGKSLWTLPVAVPNGYSKLGTVLGVFDRNEQGVLVVGRLHKADGTARAYAVAVGLDGKAAATTIFDPYAPTWVHQWQTAALHTSGGVLLAGVVANSNQGGKPSFVVCLYSLLGKATWWFIEGDAGLRLDHLQVLADGKIAAAGAVDFDKTPEGELLGSGAKVYVLGADGSYKWAVHDGNNMHWNDTIALVAEPDGRIALLRRTDDMKFDGLERVWHLRSPVDGSSYGEPRALAKADWLRRAVGVGDRIFGVGDATTQGVPVGVSDRFGNPLWRRTVASAPAAPLGLAVSPDHERILVFGGNGATTAAPRAVVVDRWGFASCAERGACAAKSWAACSDDKDCTDDGCNAVTGCTHKPVGENRCNPQLLCTEHGSCSTGACVPDHYGRTFVIAPPAAAHRANGLTVADDGKIETWSLIEHSENPTFQISGWTTSLANGTPANRGEGWAHLRNPPADFSRNAKGRYMLASTVKVGNRNALGIDFYDGTGLQLADTQHKIVDPVCGTCNLVAVDSVAAADGAFYAIAQSDRADAGGLLTRVQADGKHAWDAPIVQDGISFSFSGGAGRADGGLLVVGKAGATKGTMLPLLLWIDADQKNLKAFLDYGAGEGAFHDVAERPDGTMLAVGGGPVGSVMRSQAVVFKKDETVVWRSAPTLADATTWNNVAMLPDDGALLAGIETLGGQQTLVLARLRHDGNVVWRRTHRFQGQHDLVAHRGTLVALDDGSPVLGAMAYVGGFDPTYGPVRADPSGFVSCQDAGGCAAKKLDACSDDNACTLDWCDAKAGCQHSKLDGVACGLGGACKAGVCVQP